MSKLIAVLLFICGMCFAPLAAIGYFISWQDFGEGIVYSIIGLAAFYFAAQEWTSEK